MNQRDQFNVKCGDLTPDFTVLAFGFFRQNLEMTKLKCQIKPKTQKFKVLSVMGLLKNSDVYYLYPTCSLV